MFLFWKKNRSGREAQFLLETMIALGVVVVGVLSVFGFIARGLSTNRVVADQFTGAYLAAEGVEVVKNIIDGNHRKGLPWNAGFSNGDFEVDFASVGLTPASDRPLRMDPNTGLWNYGEGQTSHFVRTIHVEMLDQDEMRINSLVRWSSRGGTYDVDVEDHFYNWRF